MNCSFGSKIPIVLYNVKLQLFRIITAMSRVGWVFLWYYHPFYPMSLQLHADSRGYVHRIISTERLSQPLGNFLHSVKCTGLGRMLFFFDWCCQHFIWSLPLSGRAQWECLHCTCALRYTHAWAPSAPSLTDPTFWSLDCHLDEAQLQSSSECSQSTVKEGEIVENGAEGTEIQQVVLFICWKQFSCKYDS